MVRFDIVSLFPSMFASPLQESIVKRAQDAGLVDIQVHDLRDYTDDRHRTADDTPYGGGAGMVMKVEPIVKAIEALRSPAGTTRTILMSPQGGRFDQAAARRLQGYDQLLLVCGRYEGVDERVTGYVDEEISLGDYILTGGELAALVVVDAVARLVPGVVGDAASVATDTFENALLKYPQYTRPSDFRGRAVPAVLTSGDHAQIRRWRRQASLRKTLERRPDLLDAAELTEEDKVLLTQLQHFGDVE